MAFEFKNIAASIANDSANLIIEDASNWDEEPRPRTSFGVYVEAEYRLSSTPSDVDITTYDPLTDTSWILDSPANGRYTVNSYAFLQRGVEVPSVNDVEIYTDGLLYQWDGAAWNAISLEDAVTAEKYVYTHTLEVPFLAYAYAYKNEINLEYIKQVKSDINNGVQQNKLYYKRTDLDYFSSLITGAEYNWSIALYSNYYEIVINLNNIMDSGQIS